MRIARVLYPVTVLGPGKRIAIWVAGCTKHCKSCANPELWEKESFPDMSVADLKQALCMLYEKTNEPVDGITISGGEPFEQAEELLELITFLKEKTEDILIFTGKTKEELMQEEPAALVLSEIAVLVDGEYIEEENYGEVLRGSKNQKIHIQNTAFAEKYNAYLKENEGKHLVENFQTNTGVIAVGIHKKDFKVKLEEALKNKNLIQKTEV